MAKREQDFIKISQVVGQVKVLGSLSFWQIIPLVVVILLSYGLCSFIGLFNSLLVGVWVLGTIFLVTGARPDHFLRRLLGKPKRWRRGFRPSSSLLVQKSDIKSKVKSQKSKV